MPRRVTVALDDRSYEAAQALSHRYECSTAEAIRKALVCHREAVLGASGAKREERIRNLEELFDLFEGNDADEEIRRRKAEDEWS